MEVTMSSLHCVYALQLVCTLFRWTVIQCPHLCLCAGCLAVAELGRRGLLLPERLEDGKSHPANVGVEVVLLLCTCVQWYLWCYRP